MICGSARTLIHIELDGDLPAAQWADLAGHLETCEDCRQFRRQLTMLQGAMRTLAASEGPAVSIPMTAAPARRASWIRSLAVAAGIAILIGAGVVTYAMRHPSGHRIVRTPTSPIQLVENVPVEGNQPPRHVIAARVEFARDDGIITVPIQTKNPKVTIIWLYPTIQTAEATTDNEDTDETEMPS